MPYCSVYFLCVYFRWLHVVTSDVSRHRGGAFELFCLRTVSNFLLPSFSLVSFIRSSRGSSLVSCVHE